MVVFLLDSLRVFTIFVYVSLLNFFCSELSCTLYSERLKIIYTLHILIVLTLENLYFWNLSLIILTLKAQYIIRARALTFGMCSDRRNLYA